MSALDDTLFFMRTKIMFDSTKEPPIDSEPETLIDVLNIVRYFVGHENVAAVMQASMRGEYWVEPRHKVMGYMIVRVENV